VPAAQPEPVEGEVVEEPTQEPRALELHQGSRPETGLTLFRTTDPVEIVGKAQAVADALKNVLDKQNLIQEITIKGRTSKHVRVEGWTLLGTMLGVYPVCTWTRRVRNDDEKLIGWEARVEARRSDGLVVGAAEGECLRTETRWEDAADHAIRSMAQTRATSKALRLPLGFVVSMAGYNATPAEEAEVASGDGGGGGKPAQRIKDPDSPATQKQIGLVSSLAGKLEIGEKDRHGEASKVVKRQIHSFKQLTKGEASQIIEAWKATLEGGEAGGGGATEAGDAPSASEPKGALPPPTPTVEDQEADEWRQTLQLLDDGEIDEHAIRETALARAASLHGNKSKVLMAYNRGRAKDDKARSAKDVPAAALIRELILGQEAG
jgi:hypothetical protein